MENQKKEDELRKKSLPELEEEKRYRITEEREEIIQRGDGPAIVMRTRNSTITSGEGEGEMKISEKTVFEVINFEEIICFICLKFLKQRD